MDSVLSRVARGVAIACFLAVDGGCHPQHAANATSLTPQITEEAGAEPSTPLLTRGDKVLVLIDGEKRGTGTYNGDRVVLDPPLDTLTPERVDSVQIRVGPAAREMYGVSYRMVGVLLVWLRPE
jgi:hypothetical protein